MLRSFVLVVALAIGGPAAPTGPARAAQATPAPPPQVTAVPELLDDLRFSADGRTLYAVKRIRSTVSGLYTASPGGGLRLLRPFPDTHGAVLRPDLRAAVQYLGGGDRPRLEVRGLATQRLLTRIPVADYTFGEFRALWSPDGSRFVAELETRRGTRVFDGRTGRLVRILDRRGLLPQNAWAADSRRILVFDRRGGAIVDVVSGRRTAVPGGGEPMALSHDATRVVVRRATGPVVVTVATGDARPLPMSAADAAAWAPDGRRVAVYTGGGDVDRFTVSLVDVETMTATELVRRGGLIEEPMLTWSRDGRRLAFSYQRPVRPSGR